MRGLALIGVFLLAGCGGSETSGDQVNNTANPAGLIARKQGISALVTGGSFAAVAADESRAAEVGRQPWVVYGLLRTREAVTPALTSSQVLVSLAGYVAVYAVIYAFGLFYIYRLLRDGPADETGKHGSVTPGRPVAVALSSGAE